MRFRTLLLLSLLAGCTAGCTHAIAPAPEPFCAIKRYTLGGALDGEPVVARPTDQVDELAYETVMYEAMDRAPAANRYRLFISGGGQNGAFGAGYLDGWQQRTGKLPEFAVVTGISTGALLATPAFINRPDLAVAGYTIPSEQTLFDVRGTGPLGVVRRGAVGTLDPTAKVLDGLIGDDVLEAVATGHRAGRRLLVGAVDVDLGQAVGFDMGDLAMRWSEADATDRDRLKGCYIKALLASSAVPGAFKPITIDNRLYVDGSTRFGVFSDNIGDLLAERLPEIRARRTAGRTTILVNGTLEVPPRCRLKDAPPDSAGQAECARSPSLFGRHRGWSITDLLGRSVAILVNQVSVFSAAAARGADVNAHLVRISRSADTHEYTITAPDGSSETRSCADWREQDRIKLKPVEFHPSQMRCLIDYGRKRALADPVLAGKHDARS